MEELTRFFTSLETALPLYFWLGGVAVIIFLIFCPLRKRRALSIDLGYWKKKIDLKSRKTWLIPALIVAISVLTSLLIINPQIVATRTIPRHDKVVMSVVDVSGSMDSWYNNDNDLTKLERTRETFFDIAERDLGAEIGVLIYSSSSYIVRDPVPKLELLKDTLENKEEINKISLGTETDLALAKARRFLSKKVPAGDKAIILFSDLEDDLSEVAAEIRQVLAAGIKMYIIVVEGKVEKANERMHSLQAYVDKEIRMAWVEDEAAINQITEEIKAMEISLTGKKEILSRMSLIPFLVPAIIALLVFSVVLSETIFRKIP